MSWMFGADAKDVASKEKTNRPTEWVIAAANRCIEFMILQQELWEEELEKARAELKATQVLFYFSYLGKKNYTMATGSHSFMRLCLPSER